MAVSEHIIKYVAALVRATRPKDASAPKWVQELVDWGAGPRAGQFLIHGGKALAAMDGRFSVAIDDVQKVRGAGVAASHQHELSGAGRRDDDRRSCCATYQRDSAAGDSEVLRVEQN